MKPSVRLGRVAGIPLAAHWTALIVPLLIADILGASLLPSTVKGAGKTAYWVTAALVAAAFVASLAAHELAHAITARRRGVPVAGITLWMLGGVTQIEGEARTPRDDLAIAVAGPLTSLVCGGVAGVAALAVNGLGWSRVAAAGLVWLAVSNVLLALFNMLPGAPLDGGRVLRAIVWRRGGDRTRAELTATRAGRMTGLALVAVGGLEIVATSDFVGGVWLMLIGWFLASAATNENAAARAEDALAEIWVDDVMDRRVLVLPSYQSAVVAARRAIAADVDYCPVTDFDGHIVGIVEINQLVRAARLPTGATVSTVTRPIEPELIAHPHELLSAALHRAGHRLPLVVIEGGEVVGLVTSVVITHALRRGLLRQPVMADGQPATVTNP